MSNEKNMHQFDELMTTYYKQIGQAHIENILAELDEKRDEINRIKIPQSLNVWVKKQGNKKRRKDFYRRITSRASLVVLFLIASLAIITFTVEAVRVQVYNLILETNERYTSISYEEAPNGDSGASMKREGYYPTYVPEGFVLSKEESYGDMIVTVYEKGNEQIRMMQSSLNGDTQLDTEDAEVIHLDIQGNEGLLILKEERVILHWANHEAVFDIIANIEPEKVLQMAESFTK
jgi:hypothetical protein